MNRQTDQKKERQTDKGKNRQVTASIQDGQTDNKGDRWGDRQTTTNPNRPKGIWKGCTVGWTDNKTDFI